MKLQIKRRDDKDQRNTQGLTGHDYLFLLDGIDISDALTEISLKMGAEDVNSCTIKFMPDDVEVDADALTALTTVVQSREKDDTQVHLPQLISSRIHVSSSEARRLLHQGAVKRNGQEIKDLDLPESEVIDAEFQIGKRRFFSVGYSLFVLATANVGQIVTWGRDHLPVLNRRVDGLELQGGKDLLKFRLTDGLIDSLRREVEAMAGVEQIEVKLGDVALVQSGLAGTCKTR